MKVKNSFVTNSSSTNYLLIVQKDLKDTEIYNILLTLVDKNEYLYDVVQELYSYASSGNSFEEFLENLLFELANRIGEMNGLELDHINKDYYFDGGIASSEGEIEEECFYHFIGSIRTKEVTII